MQNTKKYLIIMVAVAFGIAVIAACVTLFSVKKVSAEFSVYGDSQAEEIQAELDGLKGKNMVFLKKSEVYAICDKYPYYEVTSVEKSYPNVLKVSIAKRVEAFTVQDADKAYVLDSKGVVLNDKGEIEFPQNAISIDLGDFKISDGTVGKKIVTSDDELFYSVIKASQSSGIVDVVKSIKLDLVFDGENYTGDAWFHTYTGVSIDIDKVNEDGEEKIKAAFEFYESLSDYDKTKDMEKTSRYIFVCRVKNPESKDDGKIVPSWNREIG